MQGSRLPQIHRNYTFKMEDQVNKLAQTIAELTTTITNLQITHRTELERLAQQLYEESEWNNRRL